MDALQEQIDEIVHEACSVLIRVKHGLVVQPEAIDELIETLTVKAEILTASIKKVLGAKPLKAGRQEALAVLLDLRAQCGDDRTALMLIGRKVFRLRLREMAAIFRIHPSGICRATRKLPQEKTSKVRTSMRSSIVGLPTRST